MQIFLMLLSLPSGALVSACLPGCLNQKGERCCRPVAGRLSSSVGCCKGADVRSISRVCTLWPRLAALSPDGISAQ